MSEQRRYMAVCPGCQDTHVLDRSAIPGGRAPACACGLTMMVYRVAPHPDPLPVNGERERSATRGEA